MTGAVRLTRHTLRRYRGLTIAACTLLFLLQILLALVARSFEVSNQFSQLSSFIPEFIRPFLDQSFLAILSFSGMVSFGYTHPIVLILMIAQVIAVATEPVAELESKFVDLVMARPVARSAAIARAIAAMTLVTLCGVGSMVVGTWTGLALLAPEGAPGPAPRTVLSLALSLSVLVLSWGAIALAVGSLAKRRAAAATITSLFAFSSFVLDFVGRMWNVLAPVARLSPFHYYEPLPLIGGRPLDADALLVLGSIVVVACLAAWFTWTRRDL